MGKSSLPSGSILLPKPKTGQFLDHAYAYGGTASTLALTAANLYGGPFAVGAPVTVDQVSFEVTTQSSAGTSVRCGLMVLDPATAWAANLLSDIFAVLADTTGAKTNAFAYTFVPGFVYLPVLLPEANVTVRGLINSRDAFGAAAATSGIGGGLSVAQAYGALPGSKTFNNVIVGTARVRFRVA